MNLPDRTGLVDTSWRAEFLDTLGKVGVKSVAARKVGVTPKTITVHEQRDPDFREDVAEALKDAADLALYELRRRAMLGNKRTRKLPNGEIIEEATPSDFLLLHLNKALNPDLFTERKTIQHSGTLSLAAAVALASSLDPDPDADRVAS